MSKLTDDPIIDPPFISNPMDGVALSPHRSFTDSRGCLSIVWPSETLPVASMLQVVTTLKGTIRGLHFQQKPFAQAKTIRVWSGRIFDVFVDIRPESPTRGQHGTVVLCPGWTLHIPQGFAHGYQTLEDSTCVEYAVSHPWHPSAERGYRWNDPALGIVWPLDWTFLNERDRVWPDFDPQNVEGV